MIIEEYIMKRYTLGFVIGIAALISFAMYKSPTMTAATQPGTTKAITSVLSTRPLTLNVNNESNDNLIVRGIYSSMVVPTGKVATQKIIETRSVAKKSSTPVLFNSKAGYDRLEIEFVKETGNVPVRSVHIIHSAAAPSSQQTVTIK